MPHRARSLSRRRLATSFVLLLSGAVLLLGRPAPAAATVTHALGFRATVDGFTSWYGSYEMGAAGRAWCIDHGSHAPDPAYRYMPADLSAVPAPVQSAMAWAVGTNGNGNDRVTHAALMLALHDLMGARYPSGRLDVDRLAVTRLSGFGGGEGEVLGRARTIKADALAHGNLRGPLRLTVEVGPTDAAGSLAVTARIVDVNGRGISGMAISFEGSSSTLSQQSVTTGADGTAVTTARAGGAPTVVQAAATVPHLPLDAWESSTRPAQRVALPTVDHPVVSAPVPVIMDVVHHGRLRVRKVDAEAGTPVAGAEIAVHLDADADGSFELPIARFTSTIEPAVLEDLVPGRYAVTELAAPPGYWQLSEPLIVDLPADGLADALVPNVAMPPSTTTTEGATPATAPAPTAPTTTVPAIVLAGPPAQPPSLPRTGVDVVTLALFGTGLVLLGRSLVELVAAQPSAPSARSAAMRSSS